MIPTLRTARLTLRGFTMDDCADVERLAGHASVAATTANIPHPYPPYAARTWVAMHLPAFVKGTLLPFAITDTNTNVLLGCVSIGIHQEDQRGELGYWLGVDYWNQGFTTEATRECMRYAFETQHLAKIGGAFFTINPASGRVMAKLGMIQEGYRRRHMMKSGVLMDLVEYGILREEFEAKWGKLS